jgi:hypothetical protein
MNIKDEVLIAGLSEKEIKVLDSKALLCEQLRLNFVEVVMSNILGRVSHSRYLDPVARDFFEGEIKFCYTIAEMMTEEFFNRERY